DGLISTGRRIRGMLPAMEPALDCSSEARREAELTAQRRFRSVLVLLTLLLNAAALAFAAQDGGWGAVAILIAIAPIANGVLLLLALIAACILRACHPGIRRGRLILWCVLVPLAGLLLESAIIIWVVRPSAC
ncbi:MAG TPA: hypothetical protein VFY13_09035, partial [Luteolibacter sp.]|nr:hypothetical protein [Luteolibacter sp.]